MSLDESPPRGVGLDIPSEPLVRLNKQRKRVAPKQPNVVRKKKQRETPRIPREEMPRRLLQLKSFLIARKSNLERGRTDEAAKLEVKALQAHLDFLRNLE